MTIEVETGTGSATAESYASVDDADLYCSSRGLTAWAALATANKEAALRNATDFMVQSYRYAWSGSRTSSTQALDWPRWNVPLRDVPGGYASNPAYYPINKIPEEVKHACALLALKSTSGELAPDLGPQKASVKIGPIETSYAQGARQNQKFIAVERMMQAYFVSSGNSIALARA